MSRINNFVRSLSPRTTEYSNELDTTHSFYHPANFLLIMSFCMALVFSTWQVLLNNFVIEQAAFTGKEIGILQSLREVPGFLAFTAIYILLFIKEQ
ncbi:MAG: MFS transporter, partial [Glaciecola sp.]